MFKKLLLSCSLGILLGVGTVCAEVIVRVGPPRPLVERRPVRPGRDFVWIAGYHRWDGRAFVWVPGRWERPPRRHAAWVPYHWVHRHRGWVLVGGRWR